MLFLHSPENRAFKTNLQNGHSHNKQKKHTVNISFKKMLTLFIYLSLIGVISGLSVPGLESYH